MSSVDITLQPFGPSGAFFESPRWRAGEWWVSDMFGDAVLSLDQSGAVVRRFEFDDHPSGLGWLPDGRLLVVLMNTRQVVAVDDSGRTSVHAELGRYGRGPANDLVVDGAGRAWVGFLGFDMAARENPQSTDLVRIDPDGSVHLAATDLMTPNGAVLGDQAQLIVAETLAGRLTAFTVADDGSLTDRRVLVQFEPTPPYDDLRTTLRALRSAPDGITGTADGHLWVADAAAQACLLVDRSGHVVGRIPAPAGLSTFACAVGGNDEDRLLVCCAPDAVEARRRGADEATLLVGDLRPWIYK